MANPSKTNETLDTQNDSSDIRLETQVTTGASDSGTNNTKLSSQQAIYKYQQIDTQSS